MEYCDECQEETLFLDLKYSDAVCDEQGTYHDVYLHTCSECGKVDTNSSYVD